MKKILFFTLAATFVLASCIGPKDVSTESVGISTPIEQAKQEIVAEDQTVLAANYENYDEGSLGEAESTVLFFHAPYCASCTATDKSLKETGVSDDTKVLKLDYDTETELKKKYGVTNFHTFVQVDADGNMIKKWSGSMNAADIQEQLGESEEVMMEKEEAMEDKMEDKMEKSDDVMEDKMEKEDSMEKTMSDDKMEEDEQAMEDKMEAKTEETPAPTTSLAGVYSDYESSLVGQNEKTVLFFHAAWCPSCVAADGSISGGNVPDGLSILKTDFDTSTDLKKKYGVTSQHTFVQIDANGDLVKKWVGGRSVDDVVEKLN